MNRFLLVFIFLASAAIFQSCTKTTVTATVGNPNIKLQAVIDGVTWAPTDTISTTVAFSAAAKTKVFNCVATVAQKRVNLAVRINNNSNTPGFNIGTYTVDNTSNVVTQLFLQQKDASGNYAFIQRGNVSPGDGTIVVTAVDSVAKVITGTFNFVTRKVNTDASGNITSVDVSNVASGVFNKLPYTYTSN
ncbi:DUF6252 family protein [Mucilaginibacter ginkgonis]|uniref:Uncharacterized protein n=1 Tax=Mucilaginibacter ginkgonis TaxID=2682091 RepID=A0A6I4INH7_9SPHI|nr:DUF6252 family protein [Mucilaginibacter ginkgonis]QQL49566.1 hypothetical protein GO620_015540 [Mucilaginibacter ginkgonis]